MEFNNNDDLRRFAKLLSEKMESLGNSSMAHDLKEWNDTSFTSASEFLGELRMILERVKEFKAIDIELKQNVSDCIAAINKAFGQCRN